MVRGRLEDVLIKHKDLIATVLQKTISRHRVNKYGDLIDTLVSELYSDPNLEVSEEALVTHAGLSGKIITGTHGGEGERFSEDTKSEVFIRTALKSAIKCPICSGFLDQTKSVSYDHISEKTAGGRGSVDNCQLTHPYCNQALKNREFQERQNTTGRNEIEIQVGEF